MSRILFHTQQCLFLQALLDMGEQGRFSYSCWSKHEDEEGSRRLPDSIPHRLISGGECRVGNGVCFEGVQSCLVGKVQQSLRKALSFPQQDTFCHQWYSPYSSRFSRSEERRVGKSGRSRWLE